MMSAVVAFLVSGAVTYVAVRIGGDGWGRNAFQFTLWPLLVGQVFLAGFLPPSVCPNCGKRIKLTYEVCHHCGFNTAD